FTEDDGLFTNDLNVTFARLSNGNIVMVSGNYAAAFPPAMVQQQTIIPALLFTNAAAGNIEKNIKDHLLNINWNEKNIQLNWALLNYSNPFGNVYYYKLDGINSNWQTAGNRGQVSFNSLDAGTYTFHYKAATSEGIM